MKKKMEGLKSTGKKKRFLEAVNPLPGAAGADPCSLGVSPRLGETCELSLEFGPSSVSILGFVPLGQTADEHI